MVHFALFSSLFLASTAFVFAVPVRAQTWSIRFYGHGVSAPDLDRIKIPVDSVGNADPGPPADVGASDFTIELWLRGNLADNSSPAVTCGNNVNWINGNIVLDRDRYNQDRKLGLSIAGGKVVFGVSGDGTGDRTLCGSGSVLDGGWHHVAVQRRRSDGMLWLCVDGSLQGQVDGPDGDVSYPDDGIPCATCCDGGNCNQSDPFLVVGAEKHDAGASYPSFRGWVDELRLSTSLRYSSSFTPSGPFAVDGSTAALYHFDEGPTGACSGGIIDANGDGSPGTCHYGGSAPTGPEYSIDTPFASSGQDDAAVTIVPPLRAVIPSDKPAITKKVRVKVTNVNATTSQTMQLTATSSDCPSGTILQQPDFEPGTAGAQTTVTLAARRARQAIVLLDVTTAFDTFNRKAPARCAITFTVASTAVDNVDPTPSNNSTTMELNALDLSDVEQTTPHETVVESFRPAHPGKIEIYAGNATKTDRVRVSVTNADTPEEPGDLITLTATDGDCPPGTVGVPDFDPVTAGAQSSVVVEGKRTVRGTLELTVHAADFYSPARHSMGRCTAWLTVVGPGGDSDPSNNATRVPVQVLDRNDFE